jgi:hypothetical protein
LRHQCGGRWRRSTRRSHTQGVSGSLTPVASNVARNLRNSRVVREFIIGPGAVAPGTGAVIGESLARELSQLSAGTCNRPIESLDAQGRLIRDRRFRAIGGIL